MSKGPTKSTVPLIKEQLLPEYSFINYCNRDDANKYSSGRKQINAEFVHAAKKEGLLRPLYSAEENARQPDGSEKSEIIDYYSPLQFYIVTELLHNIVRDGVLWYPESTEWYPGKPLEERPRYILWGTGMAFPARKEGESGRNKIDGVIFNPYAFTPVFDDFLRFIHTTPVKDRYATPDGNFDIFAHTPVFVHDLSKILSLPDEIKKYKLNAKKLEDLRMNVGRAAAILDPLELWYYYTKRHPGRQKGLLKGDAHVAQQLYWIYDLITEVWEVVTGDKPQPFLEFIGGEFGSGYLTPRVEYLHGTDVQAMRHSVEGFNTWAHVKGNGKYVTSQIQQALATVVAELDDYEKRYGDRSYGDKWRTSKDEVIQCDQLDDVSKQHFDQWRKESAEEDWSIISSVIGHRLDDIRRALLAVYRSVSGQLGAITANAWDAHKNHFWPMQGTLPREEAMALIQKENMRLLDNARKCQEKERAFGKSVSAVELAFCKVCRKQPIQLHTGSNRWGFHSQPSICDDCVGERKEFPDNTKDAEWRCEYCEALVYKFVHGNTWSTRTEGHVQVVSELTYGKVELKAVCPNKGCKKELRRTIEWGWLP